MHKTWISLFPRTFYFSRRNPVHFITRDIYRRDLWELTATVERFHKRSFSREKKWYCGFLDDLKTDFRIPFGETHRAWRGVAFLRRSPTRFMPKPPKVAKKFRAPSSEGCLLPVSWENLPSLIAYLPEILVIWENRYMRKFEKDNCCSYFDKYYLKIYMYNIECYPPELTKNLWYRPVRSINYYLIYVPLFNICLLKNTD